MSKWRKRSESALNNPQSHTHKPADTSRRNFLKTAGLTAGAALIPASSLAQGKSAAAANGKFAFPQINQQFMITPDQAWDWDCFQEPGRPHLCRQRGLEALHRLPDLEDAGVRRRRPGLRRDSLRPLHRGRLAGSAHPHPRLRHGGREARYRRNAGAGRGLLRHDVRLHAAGRHHRADALLRPRPSAGRTRDRREDSRIPDRALPRSAVLQFVPG